MKRLISVIAIVVIIALLILVTLSPSALRPRTGHVVLERMAAYAALGSALALAYPSRPLKNAAFAALFAIGLEALQLFTRDRHGQIYDALEKAAGGSFGVFCTTVLLGIASSLNKVQE